MARAPTMHPLYKAPTMHPLCAVVVFEKIPVPATTSYNRDQRTRDTNTDVRFNEMATGQAYEENNRTT